MTDQEKQKLLIRAVMMEIPFLILGVIGWLTTGHLWVLFVAVALGMTMWIPVILKIVNSGEQK